MDNLIRHLRSNVAVILENFLQNTILQPENLKLLHRNSTMSLACTECGDEFFIPVEINKTKSSVILISDLCILLYELFSLFIKPKVKLILISKCYVFNKNYGITITCTLYTIITTIPTHNASNLLSLSVHQCSLYPQINIYIVSHIHKTNITPNVHAYEVKLIRDSVCDKSNDLTQAFYTGERPSQCNVCDKRIVRNQCREYTKSTLIQCPTMLTQVLHNREKPSQCSICSKRFIYNQCRELILIQCPTKFTQVVHKGDKPFQYIDYDKQHVRSQCQGNVESILILYAIILNQSYYMEERSSRRCVIDKRFHTGEWPNRCSVCDKRFSRNQCQENMEFTKNQFHICHFVIATNFFF